MNTINCPKCGKKHNLTRLIKERMQAEPRCVAIYLRNISCTCECRMNVMMRSKVLPPDPNTADTWELGNATAVNMKERQE